MNKRWIAISTVCVGMAAAPFGFDLGHGLSRSVDAQDAVIVTEFTSVNEEQKKGTVPVFTAVPVFTVSEQPTGQQAPILSGCGNGDGCLFDSVELLEGGFFLNVESAALSDPKYKLNQWGTGNLSNGTITLNHDGQKYGIRLIAHQAVNATSEPNQTELSKEFLELSARLANLKLKRTRPQLLALELEKLKKEISDQEAALKLDEAQEQLRKILNDHPESPAAESAKKMLWEGSPAQEVPARIVPTRDLPTY